MVRAPSPPSLANDEEKSIAVTSTEATSTSDNPPSSCSSCAMDMEIRPAFSFFVIHPNMRASESQVKGAGLDLFQSVAPLITPALNGASKRAKRHLCASAFEPVIRHR